MLGSLLHDGLHGYLNSLVRLSRVVRADADLYSSSLQ